MKCLWYSFLIFSGFFSFLPASVFADSFWSETVPLSGGYAVFSSKDADFFSFSIPSGASVEMRERGEWIPVAIDDEQDPSSQTSELLSVPQEEDIVLRFSGEVPKFVTADFSHFDPLALQPNTFASNTISLDGFSIISRAGWGADESWRYSADTLEDGGVESKDSGTSLSNKEKQCVSNQEAYPEEFEIRNVVSSENGKKLLWPYQYSKQIRKIVIHHTAESGVEKGHSADEVLRAIYRYHAVSRGWGDIGYHYIIAPDGTVFQGRAGGDYVVGGHVYCNNIGTIGIALMGNFNETDPTQAQINALSNLLPRLAKKYELDLTATSWYHGKDSPNLVGHRDLGATACPGENLYELLPSFREMLDYTSEIRIARSAKVDGEPVGSPALLSLQPGKGEYVTFSFLNTGNADWTGTTWLFASPGDGVNVQSVSKTRSYVAANMKEKNVKPGQVGHFEVRIDADYDPGMKTILFVPVVKDQRIKNAETLQVVDVQAPEWGIQLKETRLQPKIPVTGKTTSFSVDLKNTGGTEWIADDISLLATLPDNLPPMFLKLKANTLSGGVGTFTGRLPAFRTAGEKKINFQLLLGTKKLSVTTSIDISVEASQNKATALNFPKRASIVSLDEGFQELLRFANDGNAVWEGNNLSLTLLHRREKKVLTPEESEIEPGETATFPLETTLQKGAQPFVVTLKDGQEELFRKVFLLVGVDNTRKKISSKQTTSVNTKKEESQKNVFGVENKTIRIRLSFPADLKEAEITGESDFEVRDGKGNLLFPGKKGQTIPLEIIQNEIAFHSTKSDIIRILPKTADGVLQISNWNRIPAWDVNGKYNDNRFRGVLEFRVLDGKLVVINELFLKDYLLGIGETQESDHLEKKKALAVAARSYAAFYLDENNRKYPGMPYDGSDDPAEFQKYLGQSLAERAPDWKKAVQETENKVLTFEGEIVKAPFHTSSGGMTISAKEKWGWTNTPYLVAVSDPGCAGKSIQGHGVGMSGCGAEYFAESGKSYLEILEYFYPGTAVEGR